MYSYSYTTTHTCDKANQLVSSTTDGKDLERYTYDPAGNRLSKTINGVTTTYTYDKANQLVTSTVNGVTTHYKYEAAGYIKDEDFSRKTAPSVANTEDINLGTARDMSQVLKNIQRSYAE